MAAMDARPVNAAGKIIEVRPETTASSLEQPDDTSFSAQSSAPPEWDETCFYSAPIDRKGTEKRQHSDAFLRSIVRPAVRKLATPLEVVRADSLPSSPITGDVVEHVYRSRLLIADLSFHNPNVILEVGLRMAIGRPFVLLSRTEDEIPSNLKEQRILRIDTSGKWSFMEGQATCRDELVRYATWALSKVGQASSPIQKLFPDYRRYLGPEDQRS